MIIVIENCQNHTSILTPSDLLRPAKDSSAKLHQIETFIPELVPQRFLMSINHENGNLSPFSSIKLWWPAISIFYVRYSTNVLDGLFLRNFRQSYPTLRF